jgi:hypothetical protein
MNCGTAMKVQALKVGLPAPTHTYIMTCNIFDSPGNAKGIHFTAGTNNAVISNGSTQNGCANVFPVKPGTDRSQTYNNDDPNDANIWNSPNNWISIVKEINSLEYSFWW